MIRISLVAATVAACVFSASVHAEDLSVVTKVYEAVEVEEDGKKVRKLLPATKVIPGDEVTYVTRFKNNGSKPAGNIVINNPVPANLVYTAGSASGSGTEVLVSVDGGSSFDKLSRLRVPDGDGSTRAATGADVTHIRWLVNYPLAPGVEGNVTYRARVK